MNLECTAANYYGADYLIFNDGTLYGKRKMIKSRVDADGYLAVTVGDMQHRTCIRVHRIIAEQFVPNPNNLPEVNHIDYNRLNPSADNLEWVSHQDNVTHSVKAGHYADRHDGEKNGRAKTTYEEVSKMREEYKNGTPIYVIAKKYGKPWSTVGNIVHNKTWTQ
nr:MAG TPA: homing endonuclease [Caudoviricetes sp.]